MKNSSVLSRRSLGLLGCCLVIATSAATAEEKSYVLASSSLPAAGLVKTTKQSSNMTDVPLTIKVQGNEMGGTMNQKATTTVKVSYQGADKFTKELTESTTDGSMEIAGQKNPQPSTPSALLNVPVTYERKDGAWTPSLASGAKPSVAQMQLIKASRDDQPTEADMIALGETPRKVGDKWQVDASKLPAFGGLTGVTGTISYEFLEVKDVDGQPCALLKGSFDVKGTPNDAPNPSKMSMHMTGAFDETRSLEYRTDVGIEMKAQLEMEATVGDGVEMKMNGPFLMSQKSTLEKK